MQDRLQSIIRISIHDYAPLELLKDEFNCLFRENAHWVETNKHNCWLLLYASQFLC